jgi:hypothetical protein
MLEIGLFHNGASSLPVKTQLTDNCSWIGGDVPGLRKRN